MSKAPAFRVVDIVLFERPVDLRLPFRFGIVTLTHAPQAFVQARIEFPDGRISEGAAAELMVPKWFDKDPAKSNEQNFDQLRGALRAARAAYVGGAARTAFGHFVVHHAALVEAGAAAATPELAANFGPALVDRAIADALGRSCNASFHELLAGNALGIEPVQAAADLAEFDAAAFLEKLPAPDRIAARHTVGLADRLRDDDPGAHVQDGLPETLESVVARYGMRHFKLKVAGEPAADFARLAAIAAVLDAIPQPYCATLDGNEQYPDIDAVAGLFARLAEDPATRRLAASILFVEQPAPRAIALALPVHALARRVPVIIDESDAPLDAFATARDLGYTGVSSKACKGIYRSVINAMRCAQWTARGDGRFFLSGEDLTTQAGLAVQQDLALSAVLGIRHVERNGHHYVNGFAGQHAPAAEQAAFLAAHPDLYEESAGSVRLRIHAGELRIGSLNGPGFASGAYPDWSGLATIPIAGLPDGTA